MILKTPHGTPVSLFFLTNDMYNLLASQSIPLREVFNLAAYHQQLTYGEVATMVKFQYTVAQEMGVPLLDPQCLFGEGFYGSMVKETFNTLDSKSLAVKFKEANSFHSLNAGGNVLVVLLGNKDGPNVPGWKSLSGDTFSSALLEAVYSTVGYLEAHNGTIPKPALGEVTLAEVYKLLSIQNP